MTGAEYAKRAEELKKALGLKAYPVIRREHEPGLWTLWLRFYRWAGLLGSVEYMERHFEKTVPCLDPVEFCPEWATTLPKKESKLFRLTYPQSEVLMRRVTKEYGRSMVQNGALPRGSIWIPGSLDDRNDIGDVYGPDPDYDIKLVPISYETPREPWQERTPQQKAYQQEAMRKFREGEPVNADVASKWERYERLPKGKLDSNWRRLR